MSADSVPEQTFFEDPAIDRAVAMIMTLAAELAVAKDRLRAMEVLLVRQGALQPDALDAYQPDAEEAKKLAADRDAFARQIVEAVKGTQASLGAPADVNRRFA
ncbi:hypothetical protein VB735_01720 [Halotia wernerae UHCC 0503]|jgi:hypothetical protein|nr:hypothetical protein [Halotia wernerae UHCC 0503]